MPGTGRRWRRGVTAAACAAAMALAGCSPGSKPHSDPAGGAVLPARARAALGAGTLYLLLGPATSANLWQVSLVTGRTRQLTFNRNDYGVSNFSASPAGLVLGDASSGVDQVEIMRHDRPQPLGGGIGDSPQISGAGQIAVGVSSEDGVRRGPWSRDRVLLWATPAAPYRTIYQASPNNLMTVAWNPAGTQILLINEPDNNTGRTPLFTASAQGQTVRQLGTVPGVPSIYAWGRYGLAVGYLQPAGASEILSPSGRVLTRLPGGWVPACWNPSGSALLVMTPSQQRIGLWRPARPGTVQDLGALPGRALQECSWATRPAVGA
jgi:hypothetical protein